MEWSDDEMTGVLLKLTNHNTGVVWPWPLCRPIQTKQEQQGWKLVAPNVFKPKRSYNAQKTMSLLVSTSFMKTGRQLDVLDCVSVSVYLCVCVCECPLPAISQKPVKR